MTTLKVDALQDGKHFTPYITGKFVVVHGEYVDCEVFDSYEEALSFVDDTEEKCVIIGATASTRELLGAGMLDPCLGVEDHT